MADYATMPARENELSEEALPHARCLGRGAVIVGCALLLGAGTCANQCRELGFAYLSGEQVARHNAVLGGHAGDPWQYRVLTVYAAEGLIRVLSVAGVGSPYATAFVALRLVQNMAIMLLAYVYYRRLGCNWAMGLVGISMLGWAMTHSLWNSGLRMHTYGDMIVYLLAGLAILSGRMGWVVLIAAVGALNRETSVLVGVMAAGAAVAAYRAGSPWKGSAVVSVAAIAVFALLQLALRAWYPPQELLTPGYVQTQGIGLLWWNLKTMIVWRNLSLTLGIVPLAALAGWRDWPVALKVFFWAIVPIWLVGHFLVAAVAETSLLLVPMAVVFIPGLLAAATGRLPARAVDWASARIGDAPPAF